MSIFESSHFFMMGSLSPFDEGPAQVVVDLVGVEEARRCVDLVDPTVDEGVDIG